jgi:hypothetical protein
MTDESNKRKGAAGSIDVLASVLGLLADQASEAPIAPPRVREPEEAPPDLRLAALVAIDARLGQMDTKIGAVEAEITRLADAARRVEAALDHLRDDLQRQAQSNQRVMVIAAAVLALAILAGHFI